MMACLSPVVFAAFVAVISLAGCKGETLVALDCETNLATKEALMTITWDTETPFFKFANVQGCTKIYNLTTNGTVIMVNQIDCPNFVWGDTFTVKFHREMDVYAPPVDKSTSHTCRLVTGAATVRGTVGVTDHTSTAAYSVDNVSPEATVTFGQGQDCLTPPTGVIVGDELSMCIELKPEYRQIDPNYFDIAVRHVVAKNVATGTDKTLTYEYCNYKFYWREVSSVAVGQLMISGFNAFIFVDDGAFQQTIRFTVYLDVCLQSDGLNCGIVYGDICPPTASRKRRSVTNSTEHKELELSYNLRVYDGIPQIDSPGEEPPTSQPQDDFTDYVRIKKAAFFGILALFVLVLIAAVVSSCFLFKKARMAGKKAGFKGTGGRSNLSYRA